jgi:hypothetical protein
MQDAGRDGLSAAWGVVASVLGGGAFAVQAAAGPHDSGSAEWPVWILGDLAASAVYMCFAYTLGALTVIRGL